jgi:hypothetical protein
MSAVDALVHLEQRARLIFGGAREAENRASAARKLAEFWTSAGLAALPRPAPDLVLRTLERLSTAASTGKWDQLKLGDWSRAPWTFWLRDPPLVATHPSVIDGFGSFLARSRRVRPLMALIEAWLETYDPRLPGIVQSAEIIRQHLPADGDPRLAMWRDAQAQFGVFDLQRGPAVVAAAMLTAGDEANGVLHAAGLGDPVREEGGFFRSVVRAFLEAIRTALQQNRLPLPRLKAALSFLEHGRALRFPAYRATTAEALLLPWVSGAAPASEGQAAIQDFLQRHYGDPRLGGGARWHGVQQEAIDLFQRWLARATLREFFDVISDRADFAQWRYRRAFWSAALEAGLIEDAWVLLGRQAQTDTRSQFGSEIACGRLFGFTADQSVILMRVRHLVIAEVSHSGSLRAWEDDDPRAPRMGRQELSRDDIVVPCLPFSALRDSDGLRHDGAAAGTWQASAAALIKRHTGYELRRSVYMP